MCAWRTVWMWFLVEWLDKEGPLASLEDFLPQRRYERRGNATFF
jgi:hypothetical protein